MGPEGSRSGPDGLTELVPDDLTATLHQLTGWALRQGTVLDQLTVDRPSLEDIYLRLTDHGAPERRPDNTDRSTR